MIGFRVWMGFGCYGCDCVGLILGGYGVSGADGVVTEEGSG